MLASILASGLAAGAIYALVGVTYNTMFSTSRVMSFTAGQLAMLGGVFGSMFTLKMGMPILVGFLLTLLGCAIIGVITEFVAVRPVLKSLDQHLYVLSTLALALMIQQVAAIKWGTEPQPFPRLIGWGSGVFDEKFWLPVVACAITIVGLEYLYRRTLVGRAGAWPAGARSARRQLRARRDHRRCRRIFRRRAAAGVLCQWRAAEFLWLRAGGARRPRQQSWRHHRRHRARPVSTGREFPGRRHLLFGGGVHAVHRGSAGGAARPVRRGHGTEGVMTA